MIDMLFVLSGSFCKICYIYIDACNFLPLLLLYENQHSVHPVTCLASPCGPDHSVQLSRLVSTICNRNFVDYITDIERSVL
jgi:hypothetical protein